MERATRPQTRFATKNWVAQGSGPGKRMRGRPRTRNPVKPNPSNRDCVDQKGAKRVQVLCLSDESTGDVAVCEMVGGNNLTVSSTPESKPDLLAQLAIAHVNAQKWERLASKRLLELEEKEVNIKILEEQLKKRVADQEIQAESKREEGENEALKKRNEELTRAIEQSRGLLADVLRKGGCRSERRAGDLRSIEANGGTAAVVDGSAGRKDVNDWEASKPRLASGLATISRPDQFARDRCERPASEKLIDKAPVDGIDNALYKMESNQCLRPAVVASGRGVQDNGNPCADGDEVVDIMGGQSSDEEGLASDRKINGTWDGSSPWKQTTPSARLEKRWEGPLKYASNGSNGSNGGKESQGRQVLSPELARKQQQQHGIVDMPAALFTEVEYRQAQEYVDRDFLAWLNKRIRRPTAAEIALHKSKVVSGAGLHGSPGDGKETYIWTGISGNSLLFKYNEETMLPFPSASDLTTMFRTVMRIEGSRRTNDYLWCLVWTDCMNPEELPGYHLFSIQDSKRSRVSSPEENFRAAKARSGLT